MSRFLTNSNTYPTKIPGLQFWLDAQDTGTFTWNNGYLSGWTDKSSNAYACTQSTASNQPFYTGSNVAFGGTSNAYLTIPQAAINNAATYSIFLVVNPISATNWILSKQYDGVNSYNILSMTNTTNSGGNNTTGTSQYLYWHTYNTATTVNSSNALATNTVQLIGLHYDGTTLTMNRNATTLSATAATANIVNQTGATNANIGAWIQGVTFNNPGITNFQLSELLFYNGTLTTEQRQQVEGYLAWKWNLQASLSNDHPYLVRNPGRFPLSQTPSLTSFRPTSLSNCLLWVDAADRNTFSLTSSNTVATWFDKSGNGNSVSQSTGTQQPTWTSNVLQGFPGVLFTGGANNQRLVSSAVSSLNGIAGTTLFAVVRPTWTSGQGGINNPSFFGMRQAGTTTTKINYYVQNNYGSVIAYNGTSTVNHTGSNATSSLAQNQTILFSATNNNGTDLQYYNGSLTADSQSLGFGAGTSLPFIVGGNNTTTQEWVGYIFEIVFYPYVLTNANRQLVEGYLASKWGFSLPTGHPYAGQTSYTLIAAPNPVKPVKPFATNFSPNSISGCVLWLDGADSSTMGFSSATNIAQWRDKSPNGYIGVGSGTITYTPNVQAGLPAVGFNGSTGYFNFGDVNDLGSNQLYIFCVAKFNTSGDNGTIIAKSLQGNGGGRYSILRVLGTLVPLIGANAVNNAGISDSSTAMRLLTMVWDRSNITLYQNGTSGFTTSLGDSATYNTGHPLLVGAYNNDTGSVPPAGGLYFNGYICELVQYLAPLTSAQRQTVESYLAQKWQLATALPTNHANFTTPAGLLPSLPLTNRSKGYRVNFGSSMNISSFTATSLTASINWPRISLASYIVTLYSSATNATTGGTQVSQTIVSDLTNSFSNLTPGTYYYATIQPTDGYRNGPITTTSSAIATQPSPVSTPTLSISAGVASVSWSASTTATSYTIQLYANGSLSQTNTGVTGTSTSFSSLIGNTNHYVIVTAVNSAGSSTGSQSATVLSTPNPVATPTFSLSGLSATVSWSAPSGGASSYTIQLYANGSLSQTNTGVTGTSTSFSSLSGNVTYYAAVAAINATGNSTYTNSASALSVPSAPTSPSLSITTPAPGTATVSWTAPTGGASTYTIQIYQNGGLYATNSGVGATSTTFASIPGNANYYAIVYSVNASGTSSGAQTSTTGYALLPSPVEAGGIVIYPHSSTSTVGASIYNTPAANATAYFVRLYTSTTNVSSGGTLLASLTGAQWSDGGAAYGPLTTNNWVYAQIWSSNANGSNGPYQTATVQATALTRTTAFRVFNNNAYMNFIFGTASTTGVLRLWGAAGVASQTGGAGGRGAYVAGTHNYATSTHYRATIGVGGAQADAAGKISWVPYNGNGGAGGYSFYSYESLHGGGRTAWQRWNGSAWIDVAIAGGGGSCSGYGNSGIVNSGGFAAGSGIGFQGGGGTQSTATNPTNEGESGGGGSTTAGGSSGFAFGAGGLNLGGSAYGYANVGAGGGGYYGGGAGSGTPNTGGAGGGGSSFSSGLTAVTTLNGNSASLTTQTSYLAPAAVNGNNGLLVIDM